MPTVENTGVMILAGGKGSRLRSVVSNIPKPLAPVAGKPFLFWLLRSLERQGFHEFVISSGYKGEHIQQFCDAESMKPISLMIAREPIPLGTGGAIRFAAATSGKHVDYWLIMNADTITTLNHVALLERFDPSDDGLIPACHREDASACGRLCFDENQRITRFEEKRAGAGWVNMGVYLLTRAMVEEIPMCADLSLEKTVLPQAIESGRRFSVFPSEGQFIDMGTPSSYQQVEPFLITYFKELFSE